MAISVREVAARAGVSVGTVSNVLNRPERVKPKTVARVHAAIEELGFVPNAAARQLRAGHSRSLAFIVLDIGNPFFTDVARGAEARAAEHGYTIFLAHSDGSADRERLHMKIFEQQRVGGLLISPLEEDLDALVALDARGIPVVLVDRGAGSARLPSVSVDDVAGGYLAATHLIEAGRRRLAFVGGPVSIRQVADRIAGARAAVEESAGASLRLFETDEMSLEEGRRVGVGLKAMIKDSQIDSIFAANDLIAIGIQRALLFGPEPLGMPHDVSLVGYDDIAYAASAVVPITSIRQPRSKIGSTAVDLILGFDVERGKEWHPPNEAHVNDMASSAVMYKPKLVVRASSVPDTQAR